MPTVSAEAWETTLHTFKGVPDGSRPYTAVVLDKDGTLFGIARFGGSDPNCECGTVFMMKPGLLGSPLGGSAKLTIIHQFRRGADGYWPSALILDGEGGLYGLTYIGGQRTAECQSGCGTVFRLRPPSNGARKWTHTVLYRFKGGRDGEYPNWGLVMDKDGALYGVTDSGGGNAACAATSFPPSCGVVFQLKPMNAAKTMWRETVLHRFANRDGGIPTGGLTIDPATDTIYGTTWIGGIQDNGTVFRLIPPAGAAKAWRFDTLYKFKDGNDGWGPIGAIALSKGVLYGAAFGGEFDEGVIFQLKASPSGSEPWTQTTLHALRKGQAGQPYSVTIGANGSLYMPGFMGGNMACAAGCGVIFKLVPPDRRSKKWKLVGLHRFSGTDGAYPSAPLTVVGHHVYGVTQEGGDFSNCDDRGCGVLFDVEP
jgi:hypothetical protein